LFFHGDLFQPRHGAPQKFADCRSADSQNRPDLRVAQTFQPEIQTPALLFRQTFHRTVKPQCAFPLQQTLLRILPGGRHLRLNLRIERLLRALFLTNPQSQVMGYAEHPGPRIFNHFALLHGGVEPEKSLLGGFLGLGRMDSQHQKVAINVLARLLKQLRHLILQRRNGAVWLRKAQYSITKRMKRHH